MNAAAARKNLVVVRAGKNSLHPSWLLGSDQRNWDLIVSLYDPQAHFEPQDDVQAVIQPGGKWDGLYELFADGDLLSRYEFFWLPDDDIAATTQDVNAIFDAMRRYQLEVAQPALTRDSYFTHFLCMQCPGFALRYSNFVEIMVPCVSAALWQQVFGDLRESMSGFGMDTIWCRLSDDPRHKAAIIDSVAVRHTRPVGKVLRSQMAGRGRTPEADRETLHAHYGVTGRTLPLVYAAVDQQGQTLEGCTRLAKSMAWRYLSVLGDFRQKGLALEKILQIVRRQTSARPDLSPLHRTEPR